MVFFKVEAMCACEGAVKERTRQEQRAFAVEIAEKTDNLFRKAQYRQVAFMVSNNGANVVFAMIVPCAEEAEKTFEQFLRTLPFKLKTYKMEETTFGELRSMLSCAERNDYIYDMDIILDAFGIQPLIARQGPEAFGEALVNTEKVREQLQAEVEEMLFGESMLPEIDRIYAKGNVKNVQGHPVQYMLSTDDPDSRKTMYKALLSALYANGRIRNQRYSFVNYNENSRLPGAMFESLYKSSGGGAVVIRYTGQDCEEDEFGNNADEVIAALCEIATKYKQTVLTIICLPKGTNSIKEKFLLGWGDTAFVELQEDVVYGERAYAYLKGKAKAVKARTDKKLFNRIEEGKGYVAAELNLLFEDWYQKKLRNEIYPQYKTAQTAKKTMQKKQPRGSSFQKLQSLIGLERAKETMKQALNYFKVQKMFADKGLKNELPSMHMVFTGNPGTAKTTVARLFAEIMKENGILTGGTICEVGRADLVGKYVGHTAPLVKDAFKKAKGGVLFIDEAYSLVDDRDGQFGDEAINTIVQEMENNRKDTIVIFAGYPDKMEQFLDKNPGLRSRIAFHIPFEDYNTDELCKIANLIAQDRGFTLDAGAKEKLVTIFEMASSCADFGNGRYARNVIEKAKMAQASRLLDMDFESITEKEVFTLTAADIEMPVEMASEKVVKIGFCA